MNDIHPGDIVLNGVLRQISGIYNRKQAQCEALLTSYLRPKEKALARRDDEKKSDWRKRIQRAFTGLKWTMTRRKIVELFTDAGFDVSDAINDALERAFAAGMNESLYALALTGVVMWPVTEKVVAGLEKMRLLKLNRRTVKRRATNAYNESRLSSAITAGIFQCTEIKDLAHCVSKTMAHGRESDAIAAARASVYGASDTGAYYAGLEAENQGLDIEKTWLSIMDMNVRPSHKHLHGVTVPIHSVFHGYSGDLRYPHDPFAPPEETYRCRCRMAVHLAGKSPGEYSRKILPTQTSAYRKWRDEQIRKAGGEIELEKKHRRLIGG